MGIFNTTKNLASLWVQQKKRELEHATPNTRVDSGGSQDRHSWSEQKHERGKLREVKEIRDSGGIVARMMRWKALVFFGTGVELNAQGNEDLKEWIRQEAFPQLDSQLIELGEDALWFPYALGETVETRGGDFSHFEAVEPWTTLPVENEFGEVIGWEQVIKDDFGSHTTTEYGPDEIQSFIVNKSSARDNTGISDVIRAEETIEQWQSNRNAAQNAIDQAGFRRLVAKVGREDGGIIDDNELRRVRNKIDNLEEDTTLVTGPHVEFDLLDAMDPSKFKEMREMDMRDLALALGVPIEFASVISEGLGSGEQSGLRERAFILEAKAAQRLLAGQFVEGVLRPVVEEYSPYDADDLRGISFGEPMPEEPGLDKQAPYLTTNEIRERLDKPPAEDEEIGESYRKPANIQAPEQEEPEEDSGIGGIFGETIEAALSGNEVSARALQEDFDATLFELVATEEQEEFETGARLGIGVEFPNSGVYVDWNIDAWPEEDRLDGPHVSDYATREDAQKVAQGELRELSASELAEGDTDFRLEEFEAWLDDVHENFVKAEDTSKTLTQFSESQIPEMVEERMKEAIRAGAVFSHFEDLPSSELMDLRQSLQDMLTDDNWSLDNMAEELSDRFDMDTDKAETIARTETQSIVNKAAEDAYTEIEEERGEEFKFKWVGSMGPRTTDACLWLLGGDSLAENISGTGFDGTNPNYGGTPVSMEELKERVEQAAEVDPEINTEPREFTPHINCRKRYVRVVE